MQLITMAYLGEAQGVIENFELKKISEYLFEGENFDLILTGEGPFEAATVTSWALGRKNYSEIINIGIAGSLDEKLAIGTIAPIRMHYLVNQGAPQFKSYKSSDEGYDCVTSFERILSPLDAQKLKGIGVIVDREAWGVAQAAKLQKVPMRTFKLISDMAGTLGACEIVKEKKDEWAQLILEQIKSLMPHGTQTESELPRLEGFHFTFSTTHQFKNYLNKLVIKEEKSEEEILASLPLQTLREEINSPKERARLLLKYMEERLDPVRKVVRLELSKWMTPFEREGIQLQTDPQLEEEKVKVSFEVKSNDELQNKLKKLQDLSLAPYHKILNGDFHVE